MSGESVPTPEMIAEALAAIVEYPVAAMILRHALAEAEATIAAERGNPAGALPGWEHDRHTGRWHAGAGCQQLARVRAGTWNCLAMLRAKKPDGTSHLTRFFEAPTARAGMREIERILTAERDGTLDTETPR